MSEKISIKELLDGVDVEWRKLGDVCDIMSGGTPSKTKKEYWENGNILWLKSESCNNKVVDKAQHFITLEGLKNSSAKMLKKDTTLIALVGATIFKTAFLTFEATTNQNIASIKSKNNELLNDKFIFYYLTNLYDFLKFKMANYGMLNLTTLRSFQIPIPPLKVQREIVKILDNFTELTAELTAELSMRKKQYSYYRDKLLSFPSSSLGTHTVEWRKLGEVGELVRGSGLPKKDFTPTGVPAIHYGQIYTYYGVYTTKTKSFVSSETAKKLKKVNKGDVVITNTSENLEDVGKAVVYLGDEQAVTGGHATIFKPSEKIIGKYFAYFTQTEMFAKKKRKYAKGTKVIDVSTTDMAKIIIPIPPLQKQKEIVAILDKFDTLTHSISEGLPKEIELRRKQYEYYRDLLLSFPKEEEAPSA